MSRRGRRDWLDRVVYAAARVSVCIVAWTPFPIAIALARAVGTIAWLADRRHRRVADGNLRLAYGEGLTARDRRRIIRRVFGHLACLVVEVAHFHRRVTPATFRRYVSISGWDPEGREELRDGAVVVTAHAGNWELLGLTVSLMGFRFHAIERPLDNPHLARYVDGLRQRFGLRLIANEGAMRKVGEVLRSGALLGLLLDQHARKQAVAVPFFGRPAWTSDVGGRLAVRYGLPVVTGFLHRTGPGFRFRMHVDPPVFPRPDASAREEALRITTALTAQIEAFVREDPTRWLWLHRRWREVPRRSAARESV
ncbi:MAG: lysophospholipid acyltransferase family protein [Planctomycetes bacterium]|nr:lysophospholipid acyltransferase family protein [Planctomycetota bacterium]